MKKSLLGLVCLFVSIYSFGQTLENDRLALVAIYNQGDGAGWLTNWVVPGNTGDSPCGWDGVTCEGGRVTRLDLKGIGVQGTLPEEVGNLTALTYLDLTGIGAWYGVLTGDLPPSIANLTDLEYLHIAEHSFSIASLNVIGNLTNLKGVAVTPAGEVPGSFVNLINLESLYLGSEDPLGSNADFSFPSFLSVLPKLKELQLHGQVNGGLPGAVGSFSNLESLVLSINNFPNVLPFQIGNLTKLKRLYISRHAGLGDFSFLSSLLNLEELELYDNNFGATLPADIGKLFKLRKIVINSSGFHGFIPTGISGLPNLTVLDLRFNAFNGPIPDLSNIPVSGYVDISRNAFNFSGMESNISRLDAYGNQQKFKLVAIVPLGVPDPLRSARTMGFGILDAYFAGGTEANNTYKWYKGGELIATTVGDQEYSTDEGIYRVEVTNSLVPGLTLVSEDLVLVVMPVTLVSFEGKSEPNQTKLTWQTTSETNNKGFEIERSTDARTFEKIGFVDGSGDSKENQFYHFTDLDPLPTGYYRLKQLDYDGKFEHSKVIAVKALKKAIKIYPNPAQRELTVEGAVEDELVSVWTPTGKPVMAGTKLLGGTLDVQHLKEGIYTIKIGNTAKKLLIKR